MLKKNAILGLLTSKHMYFLLITLQLSGVMPDTFTEFLVLKNFHKHEERG